MATRPSPDAENLADVGSVEEGAGWMVSDFEQRWADPVMRDDLLVTARAFEAEPSMLGVSAHLLDAARDSGFYAISSNDHFVFQRPWLDGVVALSSVLERSGLTVVLAADGLSAVEIFRTRADAVRVVMVDLTMPGLDGRETLEQLRSIRPDVPAILMSGYTPADLDDCPTHEFLQKPFSPATLRATIHRILGE